MTASSSCLQVEISREECLQVERFREKSLHVEIVKMRKDAGQERLLAIFFYVVKAREAFSSEQERLLLQDSFFPSNSVEEPSWGRSATAISDVARACRSKKWKSPLGGPFPPSSRKKKKRGGGADARLIWVQLWLHSLYGFQCYRQSLTILPWPLSLPSLSLQWELRGKKKSGRNKSGEYIRVVLRALTHAHALAILG